MGRDVYRGCYGFFGSGSPIKKLNNSIIVFVPKIKNPTDMNAFRLISCANRLKAILPGYLDDTLMTFVPGRNVSNHIFGARIVARLSSWEVH